ncbi:MAG: glycoside hydrolase family 127 protein, partial [Clostridiales bacterium]|nr:glycoside hydrolase family 127 protein [Clostridiales bacterium]
MRNITFDHIDINGGFWQQKQRLIRDVTMMNVYNRFKETGRFDGMKLNWKEGMPNKPHIFYDSDVAKWLESAAYLIQKAPAPEMEKIVDETIADIAAGQDEDGYFNQYYQTCEPKENRFTNRDWHELYCLGHLIEAAVAYYKATGKDLLLKCVEKYVDLVIKCFVTEKTAKFSSPGHEEIELALVKLYDLKKDQKYLDLALHFVNVRGTEDDIGRADYNQSHLPVREQFTAEGHSVRAVYLYSAMADLAERTGDEGLKNACLKLYHNITEQRMYVTGAIGSSSNGERFSFDYNLPNIHAYAESCANLGLALFARRIALLDTDARYADTIETVIYNGFLSGLSLDGKAFFYENPLEIDPALLKRHGEHFPITQRLEVFGCSCCPPNITRFIASIGDFIYNADDDAVYVNQYISNHAEFDFKGGKVSADMTSCFPYDGKVSFTWHGAPAVVAFRKPGWCDSIKAGSDGYIRLEMKDGETADFDFEMKPLIIDADPRVQEDSGRYAVKRGPLVWCMEGVDNGDYLRDVELDPAGGFETGFDEALGVGTLLCDGWRRPVESRKNLYAPRSSERVPI